MAHAVVTRVRRGQRDAALERIGFRALLALFGTMSGEHTRVGPRTRVRGVPSHRVTREWHDWQLKRHCWCTCARDHAHRFGKINAHGGVLI